MPRSSIEPFLFRESPPHEAAAEGLAGKVAIAVNRAIQTQPAVGWVRANQIATTDALLDLNRSHNRNQQLAERIEELETQLAATRPDVAQIAGLDEKIKVKGIYRAQRQTWDWAVDMSWSQVFATLAPTCWNLSLKLLPEVDLAFFAEMSLAELVKVHLSVPRIFLPSKSN